MSLLRGLMRYRVLLLATVMSGACSVGQVDGLAPDGGGGPADPADIQSFNQMIAPMVTRCTGCHGTQQAPNLLSFEALQAKFKTKPGSTSGLVAKNAILVPAGQHQGMAYLSATELTTVTAWVDALVGQ
jgi:hypothetical protein